MYNAQGSFARKQLEKHGWTEGSGLGSSQQGISQAIRVKIKHDTTGVGHDLTKEFSNHWWDHMFNKAAASLKVKNGKDGAVVKKKEITQKQRAETAKKVLYGNFIKSSTLNNGTETKLEREGDSSDSSDDENQQVRTLLLPDEELLQKCGGRTAHKGARHGLKLNGKLARIQEHEQNLMAKGHSSSSASPTPFEPSQNETPESTPHATEDTQQAKRTKKSKKRKRVDVEDKEAEESEVKVEVLASEDFDTAESEGKGQVSEGKVQVFADEEVDSPQLSEDSGSSSGKKKRKKKKKERAETESPEKKKRKKEKNKSEDNDIYPQNDSPHPSMEEEDSVVKKRKKKSKNKSADDVCSEGSSHPLTKPSHEETCSDTVPAVLDDSQSVSVVDGEHEKSRKKSKKKKKSKGIDE